MGQSITGKIYACRNFVNKPFIGSWTLRRVSRFLARASPWSDSTLLKDLAMLFHLDRSGTPWYT